MLELPQHGWRKVILESIEKAVALVAGKQGHNVTDWRWDAEHKARWHHHPLGRNLPDTFNVSTDVPCGGDPTTVFNNSSFSPEGPSILGPCYRQIMPLDNLNASMIMVAPGNSGQ